MNNVNNPKTLKLQTFLDFIQIFYIVSIISRHGPRNWRYLAYEKIGTVTVAIGRAHNLRMAKNGGATSRIVSGSFWKGELGEQWICLLTCFT